MVHVLAGGELHSVILDGALLEFLECLPRRRAVIASDSYLRTVKLLPLMSTQYLTVAKSALSFFVSDTSDLKRTEPA